MNIIGLIIKEIYQYEFHLFASVFQKMNIPLDIQNQINMFYCSLVGRTIKFKQI